MQPESFRVNSPDVIHEMLDNEAVIIRLSTGCYYSLNRSGTDLWQALARGVAVADLSAQMGLLYDGAAGEIGSAVASLIDQLRSEELIVAVDGESNTATALLQGYSTNSAKRPFVAPTLQKYTDLSTLIMLDPIHDVDLSGWPSKRQ